MKNTNIEDKDNMHLGGTERGTEDKYHKDSMTLLRVLSPGFVALRIA